VTFQDFPRCNRDESFMALILGMDMRRRMVVVMHADIDAKKEEIIGISFHLKTSAYSDQPDQLFRAHPITNRSEATAEFSGRGGRGGSLAE